MDRMLEDVRRPRPACGPWFRARRTPMEGLRECLVFEITGAQTPFHSFERTCSRKFARCSVGIDRRSSNRRGCSWIPMENEGDGGMNSGYSFRATTESGFTTPQVRPTAGSHWLGRCHGHGCDNLHNRHPDEIPGYLQPHLQDLDRQVRLKPRRRGIPMPAPPRNPLKNVVEPVSESPGPDWSSARLGREPCGGWARVS